MSYMYSGSNYEKLLKKRSIEDGYVVLVEKYEPATEGVPVDVKEWITWLQDSKGSRYWGHYFVDKEEAEDDFASRIS